MMVRRVVVCVMALTLVVVPHKEIRADGVQAAIAFIQKIDQTIKAALTSDKAVSFTLRELLAGIPVLGAMKLPPSITKLLDDVVFQLPRVKINKDTYEMLCDDALVFGTKDKLALRLYVGPGAQGSEGGMSLSIGIAGAHTINELLPEIKQNALKLEASQLPENIKKSLRAAKLSVEDLAKIGDWIELEDIGVILATKFTDPVWGELAVGVNIAASLKVTGPLESLIATMLDKTVKMSGKDLTKIKVTGVLTPDLTGSELRAALPGQVTLFSVPLDKKNPASTLQMRTGGTQLRIGLTGGGTLTIKGIVTLDVLFPYQKDFISFNASLDILPLSAAIELAGWSKGTVYNLFGLPGFDIGNLGVGVTFSVASLEMAGAPTAISGQGDVKIGPLSRQGIFSFDLNKGQAAVIVNAGAMSSTDVEEYVLHVIDAAGKLANKKIDTTALKKVFAQAMPPFELSDATMYFVPVESEIFDVWYTPGIHIKGGAKLFGFGGEGEFAIGLYSGLIPSLKGSVYLTKMSIPKTNPLITISGAGKNLKRGDADDGPIGIIELSPERQLFFLDGTVQIPALGLDSDSHIEVSLAGIEMDVRHKLGGLFETELHIKGDPLKPDTFVMNGFMNQQGLGALGVALQEETKKFLAKTQNDLNLAMNDVRLWQQQAEKDIDAWIAGQVADTDRVINSLVNQMNTAKVRCGRANILNWMIECAEMVLVPAYATTLAAAYVHKEVTLKGVAREIAQGGVRIASSSAQLGLGAAKVTVEFARQTNDFVGKMLTQGLVITSATIEGSVKQLSEQGLLPRVEVQGTILGKQFKQVYQINFRNPLEFPAQIVVGLVQVLGPQPQPYQRILVP